jgi:hypothetical protein
MTVEEAKTKYPNGLLLAGAVVHQPVADQKLPEQGARP